ncbi:hypothetical protein CCAX7_59990 [Capsulimonas corticalis]|uniref:Uncharacterized protein n=1 Tax=Capsulimonas corticalis TaxID=2219043 RepID=A0A402CZI3_9BACT|nr:HEAT repeat domain-containing protein [Capsulimonas corticalis]BDI33948.1 hypothetical protein CCAX7_59990 [Capsulimonas corticalis]
MNFVKIVLLAICLIAFITGRGQADGLWDWTKRADIVCVASYVSQKPLKTRINPANSSEVLVTVAVTMKVTALWKGKLPQSSLVLRETQVLREGKVVDLNLNHPFASKTYSPWSLDLNPDWLIFAVRQKGSEIFAPMSSFPNDVGFRSAIPVGPLLPGITDDMSLMSKATRLVVNSLYDPEPTIARAALSELSDFEGLFISGLRPERFLPPGTDVAALKSLLVARAIPAIKRLTQVKDEETRFGALRLAAHFQQTWAIPAIAEMAQSHSRRADGAAVLLWHYGNSTAVAPLIQQLKNTNYLARIFTIEAFETLKDKRTMPFLIDALRDPNSKVRARALYMLYLITNLPTNYHFRLSPKETQDTIRYWERWGREHSAEIERWKKSAAK